MRNSHIAPGENFWCLNLIPSLFTHTHTHIYKHIYIYMYIFTHCIHTHTKYTHTHMTWCQKVTMLRGVSQWYQFFFFKMTYTFKNTIIVYFMYWRDTENEMKQFGKEMFDFCGVKVAYTSKYGHQKTDRWMVCLFLAMLQSKDTGFYNQIHCILQSKQHL